MVMVFCLPSRLWPSLKAFTGCFLPNGCFQGWRRRGFAGCGFSQQVRKKEPTGYSDVSFFFLNRRLKAAFTVLYLCIYWFYCPLVFTICSTVNVIIIYYSQHFIGLFLCHFLRSQSTLLPVISFYCTCFKFT